MEWSDEGLVLSARRHGESATVVNLLTREHGRHAGLARGGQGAKARGLVDLKGHRSVGGIRASIYNAMPVEGVEKLRDYMLEFQDSHRA